MQKKIVKSGRNFLKPLLKDLYFIHFCAGVSVIIKLSPFYGNYPEIKRLFGVASCKKTSYNKLK